MQYISKLYSTKFAKNGPLDNWFINNNLTIAIAMLYTYFQGRRQSFLRGVIARRNGKQKAM